MGASEENKEKIRASARKLFFERGYNDTTMRAIAAAAGVSTAMPNYYFDSKADIGVSIYSETRKAVSAVIDNSLPNDYDLFSRIFATVTANTLLTVTSQRYRELFLAIASAPQFFQMMRRSAANIYKLTGVPGEDAKYHAVAVGGIHASLLKYLEVNPQTSVKELVGFYVQQYVRPLNLPPALVKTTFDGIFRMVLALDMRFAEGFTLAYTVPGDTPTPI